jgi:hypothetical protein
MAQWQNGCDRVQTAGERARRRRWKLAQDAKRRGAISRPSSRRALFVRERLWGIRIGLASLPGRKIDAARQAPHDSRPGSRNNSGTMPAGLIGIDVFPVLIIVPSTRWLLFLGLQIAVTANTISSNTADITRAGRRGRHAPTMLRRRI